MHPFPPVIALVLLAMADAMAWFLRQHGREPEIAVHQSALLSVIVISLLFGGATAFWLRRFRIRFPWYAALASLAFVLALALIPSG